MKPAERREQILTLVGQNDRMSVEHLAALLGASRETVRRDLTSLSGRGLLRKVHGGAMPASLAVEDPFAERMQSQRAEKLRIGKAAAALFERGDSLVIDTGSTTVYFAEALRERVGLTVITNSNKVARTLAQGRGDSEVHLTGGRYAPADDQLVGPLAIEQIRQFRPSHAVLTVGAVDAAGRFMDYNAEEAGIARAMADVAEHTTILIDSAKFGRTALFEVCTAAQVDRVVTDAAPPGPLAAVLAASGVELIVA